MPRHGLKCLTARPRVPCVKLASGALSRLRASDCTPTDAGWLHQIETWCDILGRKVLRRGLFASGTDLIDKLMAFDR